jgi:hypothetical protein
LDLIFLVTVSHFISTLLYQKITIFHNLFLIHIFSVTGYITRLGFLVF